MALLPAGVRAQPVETRDALTSLLDRHARALLRGDVGELTATMRFAPRGFQARTEQKMRRLRAFGLASYALVLDDDSQADLSAGLRSRPKADEVVVVSALERIALKGFDARPSADPVALTVIRRGSVWSLVADDDLAYLGVLGPRGPWDFGDLRRVAEGNVGVMHHGDEDTARTILRETKEAIAHVKRRWPLRWDARILVVIPRRASELAAILQTTFDLAPFVAFAVSSLDRAGGAYTLTANRVYVQPATFFTYSDAFQADTLSHEMLHVASRPDAGAFTPAWLDEGVAQNYGERALPNVPRLARAVRNGTFDGELPRDEEFVLGGEDAIHLAYEESTSFVRYLQRRFGSDAGARLYAELGTASPDSFGTGAYHLDQAARRAFKVGFDALERAWAADVRRRL